MGDEKCPMPIWTAEGVRFRTTGDDADPADLLVAAVPVAWPCGSRTIVLAFGSVCSHALAHAQRPGCWRTREGCVVQLLVDVDENGVVFDLACVNRDGAACKRTHGLAGGQVIA